MKIECFGRTIAAAAMILSVSCDNPQPKLIADDEKVIEFEVVSCNDTVIHRNTVGAQDIKYGFEGGRVVKVGDMYHMITAEMFGEPYWVNMRLGHWESKDGIDWRRVGTIRESDGNYTGTSQRSSVWGPMVVFNDADNHWHLVYVCYKNKPNTEPNVSYTGYDGVIQHAVSAKEGLEGIYGPYEDKGILMRYDDARPDPWEGLQGVDSFFPYKIGNKWYGFYGSATTQDIKNCQWHIGLARADNVEGPWARMSELNPVNPVGFAENPIVIPLKKDLYIAIVDGGHFAAKLGYLLSRDGIHWSNIRYIDPETATKKWWNLLRTPQSLIKESDGTYTMFFTAYKNYKDGSVFGHVSKLKLKIDFLEN